MDFGPDHDDRVGSTRRQQRVGQVDAVQEAAALLSDFEGGEPWNINLKETYEYYLALYIAVYVASAWCRMRSAPRTQAVRQAYWADRVPAEQPRR